MARGRPQRAPRPLNRARGVSLAPGGETPDHSGSLQPVFRQSCCLHQELSGQGGLRPLR